MFRRKQVNETKVYSWVFNVQSLGFQIIRTWIFKDFSNFESDAINISQSPRKSLVLLEFDDTA